MNLVKLKNDAVEPDVLVAAIRVALEEILEKHPIAFYELVRVCRNPAHAPFGNAGDILKKFDLMEEGGTIHNSIRNVVLSAVAGDEFHLQLDSPYAA